RSRAALHRFDFRKIRLKAGQKYERSGYHKRIGNADPATVARMRDGPLPSLPLQRATSKGVTVRQLLTGIARRTISSCKLTLAALAALGITSATVPSAQANSKYAAIVVDANTGKTLFSSSADAARYPASLTKMMTLYLTFEALESGRLKTSSKVRFSKNAAAEPPTKLGVKAG